MKNKGLSSAVNTALAIQDIRPVPKAKPEQLTEAQKTDAAKQKLDNDKRSLYIINNLKTACKQWHLSWPNSIEGILVGRLTIELAKLSLADNEPIKAALEEVYALKSPFVPSIDEFIDLIKKHIMGNPHIPSVYKAYKEACNFSFDTPIHKWSHLAVYYAAHETGWYDLRNKEERQVLPIFKEKYESLIQQVLNGQLLTPPANLPKNISEPVGGRVEKSVAKERLSTLRSELMS